MARNSTARQQKRKTKARARKVTPRRATPVRIERPDTKRLEDEFRSNDRIGKATGGEAGNDRPKSGVSTRAGEATRQINEGGASLAERARALIMQNDPDAVRAGLAEIAAALDAVSPASLFYGRAIGTAMQALQVLFAVPFLHLQLWQNAMWGGPRLSEAHEAASA